MVEMAKMELGGGGWSFRQTLWRQGENGRHVCWIIHGWANMPVHPLFVSLIGEYLASEIYPNHDLEFRVASSRVRSIRIRWIDIPRRQMSGDASFPPPPPQQISVYIRYALETFRSRSMPRFFFEGDKWVGYAAYNNILLLARFLNSLFEEIGNILFLLLSVKRKQRIVSEKRMAVFEKSSVAHSSLVILYFYIIICFRFNGVPLQFIRRNSSYGNTLFLLLLYYYRIKPKQWIVFIWEENGRFFLGLMEVGDQ